MTFWDQNLPCVITPPDNVLAYQMLLDYLVMNVNPITGRLLVVMDVNHAIVTRSDHFRNSAIRYSLIVVMSNQTLSNNNNNNEI